MKEGMGISKETFTNAKSEWDWLISDLIEIENKLKDLKSSDKGIEKWEIELWDTVRIEKE